MSEEERIALIQKMRERSIEQENALYQKAGGESFAVPKDTLQKSHHLLFIMIFMVFVFFVMDYVDTQNDYVQAISDAVTTNETVQNTFDKIYHSRFIDYLVELFE